MFVVFHFRYFCSAKDQRVILYHSTNYTWPRDGVLRIFQNMIKESGGVTSYSNWKIYQLVETVHLTNVFIIIIIIITIIIIIIIIIISGEKIFTEFFCLVWLRENAFFVLKSKLILKSPRA